VRTIVLREHQPSQASLTRNEAEQLLATGLVSLTLLSGEGMYGLRAGSQVGTAMLPSLRLLIRPKVGLENLFFLLGFGPGITRWTDAQFPYGRDPDLFRAVAWVFEAEVRRAASQGLVRGYQDRSESLSTLRGRIDVASQLRTRQGRPFPLECRFEEYTEDIELNRVIKAAHRRLLQIPGLDVSLARRLRHRYLAFDSVASVEYLAIRGLFRLRVREPDAFWSIVQHVAEKETNVVVLQALCNTLARVIAWDEEKTVSVLERLFATALLHDEETDFSNSVIDLIVWLLIERDKAWAVDATRQLLSDPVRFAKPLQHAVREMSWYLTPRQVGSPERAEGVERAIEWQKEALAAAAEGVKDLRETLTVAEPQDERVQAKLRDVYSILDEIVTRLYFAADVDDDLRRKEEETVSDEQREQFYLKVKPLLEQVLAFARDNETGFLVAPTAHYFMQLLNGVLKYDPQGVLHMAAGVAIASRSAGYNFDTLAAREVVGLVEAILADYRSEVREGQPLQDLLNLLDVFAETGWPDALKLVWRLDEIFR
jgi:McrBC 5-methylcytosine restriction system component